MTPERLAQIVTAWDAVRDRRDQGMAQDRHDIDRIHVIGYENPHWTQAQVRTAYNLERTGEGRSTISDSNWGKYAIAAKLTNPRARGPRNDQAPEAGSAGADLVRGEPAAPDATPRPAVRDRPSSNGTRTKKRGSPPGVRRPADPAPRQPETSRPADQVVIESQPSWPDHDDDVAHAREIARRLRAMLPETRAMLLAVLQEAFT